MPRSVLPRAPRLGLAVVLLAVPVSVAAFDLDDVAKQAKAMAGESFRDPRGEVPGWLLEIGYDQWRDIRFRTDRALWADRGLPFEAQFFHPGLYYDRVVRVHEVDASGVHEVPFSPDLFDYGRNEFASRVPQGLGFAGFRLHYPLKRRDYRDELIVFLGASYFRALGREHVYGLSARGLAIDTALPSGEEFPFFRAFWLVRPKPGAREVVIYALLDSPSVTGAYRFAVRPGEQTVIDVEARLFFRRAVAKLGLGPLTSMFFFGEGDSKPRPDYRPEVHDSDGLLIAERSGEWIWRPLQDPRRLRVSAFQSPSPVGFGLLQRDRAFDHFQDLETHQEQRPSAWVAPKGGWGPGHVELVEIPTDSERHDNIVSYWVPARREGSVEPLRFAYELRFYSDDTTLPPGGRAVATRRDRGTRDDSYRYVVDFEGPGLRSIPEEIVLQGVVSSRSPDGDAEVIEQQVQKNPVTGGWRLEFQVRPRGSAPVDLRAFLRRGEQTLTETWVETLEP
ncbi:MAG: glucan biosynthesis protein G [Myxococcota bacterium]